MVIMHACMALCCTACVKSVTHLQWFVAPLCIAHVTLTSILFNLLAKRCAVLSQASST